MALPYSQENLVVSISNNRNFTFDGVRSFILNEKIRRKASGEVSGSANVAQARTEKKSDNVQRNKCKSKGTAAEVTCYQCGSKGHKKPDCKYYKAELEREKNTDDEKKMDSENEAHNSFNDKGKEKANVASSVILRSHQMQIMLKLMMFLFIFMHKICRLQRAI